MWMSLPFFNGFQIEVSVGLCVKSTILFQSQKYGWKDEAKEGVLYYVTDGKTTHVQYL